MKQFQHLQGDELLWAYNLLDCVYTRECGEVEAASITKMGLGEVDIFQQRLFAPVLHAMIRGVKIDLEARKRMEVELREAMYARESYFQRILGHPLNPRSSKQMQSLFFSDLKQPIIYTRTKKGVPPRPTLDDEALDKVGKREPILKPLVKAIQEYRSLGTFRSNYILAPLDEDDRMRCSYNICGTETFRLNSSENAFGTGTNLQNISSGTKDVGDDPASFSLPNIKSIFVPDTGFTFFDLDLKRADLFVVVWEAADNDLKKAMHLDLDMHCFSACDIFDIKGIPPEELREDHPNYKEHRGRIGDVRRQKAKVGVHAVDYLCQARTLSAHLGITVYEAQKFIDKWLGAHPGIKEWHLRTAEKLKAHRFVENILGYRRYYLGRVDDILSEALAWQPQSTVACVINRAWVNVFEQAPEIQVLLQVHDSLAGQFPTHTAAASEAKLLRLSPITLPYADPLTIPVGLKTSEVSWGACG